MVVSCFGTNAVTAKIFVCCYSIRVKGKVPRTAFEETGEGGT
jgi:hypothetical protein